MTFLQAQATPLQDLPPGESLDLVLIGKTGHGKSATANSIFGEERFVSKLSSSSVTSKCQCEIGTIGGRKICLVDTPGTMDTRKPSESLVEIGTAIAYRPNGYHAFLLVLNVNARMTPEEKMAVIMLKRMFGEDVLMKFVVLVFTHGDTFYSYQKKSKTTPRFSDYILTQSGELAGLVEECGRRCVLMNNMEDDSRKQCDQVTELIHVIDNLVAHNGGARYTNIYFEVAKKELAKYEAAEKAEIERKRKAIEDEIKTATEKRMQERKKQIEEEAAAAIDKIERKKKVIEEEIKAEEERKKEVIKQRKKEEAAAKADRERRRKMREDEIIAEEERMKEEADREWRRERQRKMWEDTFIADKERREQHERKMAEMNRQRRAKEDELFKAEQRRQEAAAEAENAKRRKDIDDAIREAETFKENRLKELREHATAEAEVEEKRRIQQLEDEAKEAVKEGARPQDTIGKAIAREAEERGVSCFPADAEVILDSGKRMKIEDVVVGDKLLAAVDDDKFEFSEVYIIVHKDDLAVADFITISTGEASVTMTPDHHVFVVVDGIKQTIPARKVEAGNHVLICSEKASLTAQVVTEITRATGTGIYNPLTMAGTIVVNDVLASCYVDCVPPKVAHPLMSPVRQIHKWAPSLSKWVNDPTKTGMPSWIEWFMEYIIVPLKQ